MKRFTTLHLKWSIQKQIFQYPLHPTVNSSIQKVKDSVLNTLDVDVHGQRPPAEPPEMLECGHCQRSVHPLRFAPHLDKCMGFGGRRTQRVVSYSTAFQDIELPDINDGMYPN